MSEGTGIEKSFVKSAEIVEVGSPKPQWKKPGLEGKKGELGELERTAEESGISLEALIEAFKTAELQELNDEDWLNLVNSDSSDPRWAGCVEDARAYLKEKGKDFDIIEEGFMQGHTLPAPVVLFQEGHAPYCIGGNSRLLGCRAFGTRPTVLALRLSSEGHTRKEGSR